VTTDESATIVGVASGTPDGGVAVVRLSGSRALSIGRALCGSLPEARRASLRHVQVASGQERALVLVMPSPGSFTGEDVVELQVHGGTRNVGEVLSAAIEAGARASGPGEFSRRAFDHGRLSLDQAEGIAALVSARTSAALEQARRLVAGEVGAQVRDIDGAMDSVRLEVEANLDFAEDMGRPDVGSWSVELERLAAELGRWLDEFERGRRLRERARVVLAGPPNAGKSALFNALLGRERAIVSGTAGTTRDYVEGELRVEGVEVVLVDTAGWRAALDPIERAGVEHGEAQVRGADLVVWVQAPDARCDAPPAIAELQAADRDGAGRRLDVDNKADLGPAGSRDALAVSAADGRGIDELRRMITGWVRGAEPPWIGLARHRDRADEALVAIRRALELLEAPDGPLELVAFELQLASTRLREIDGRASLGPIGGDVLDGIFSRFCIGK
jgi:tRNA modification GTPase